MDNKCVAILVIITLLIIYVLRCKSKSNMSNKPNYVYNKNIFIYWEQGLEHLIRENPYNAMCVQGWYYLNPDYNVMLLDKESVLNILPEMEKYYSKPYTVQQRSDILRLKLLIKYGGVWADASTLPLKPLNGNIDHIDKDTGIFFYRYIPARIDGILISSWFIIAKTTNHYLLKKLHDSLLKNLETKRRREYFIIHLTLTDLYKSDRKIKSIIDNLTITESLSHAPQAKIPYPKLIRNNEDKLPIVFKRALEIKPREYFHYINSI